MNFGVRIVFDKIRKSQMNFCQLRYPLMTSSCAENLKLDNLVYPKRFSFIGSSLTSSFRIPSHQLSISRKLEIYVAQLVSVVR